MLLPQSAQGQAAPITASVNQTTIATDELVVLTVTVTDDSAQQPRPLLPRLDGLAVVDLDIATDVDLVNGQIRTKVVYTYRLQPRRTGSLTIPPVAVKIDDQTYKTSPISIKVSQGAAPVPSAGNAITPDNVSPPANIRGKDFYIEAVVDLPTPYLGQQLIYTFRFYQALQVYREPQYDQPLFTEFETMGLPVQEYNLDVADRTYLVTEIRTALFPKSVGSITISPARLMLPGNIYEEPVDLYTEPIQVEVKPLPEAPAGFNGAVGQYDIKSWFSPEVAVVHQPSTLFVAITGIGNVRDLPELVWPELDGWQSYNSLTSLTTAMERNVMTGTRVYERVMVPGQIGEFLIPAINFVYFDPIAVEYRTISTEMLTAKVIPAPTPDPVTSGSVPAAVPQPTVSVDTPPPAAGAGLAAWRNLWDLGRSLVRSAGTVLVVAVCGVLPAVLAIGFGGNWLWQRRYELLDRLKAQPETKLAEKTAPQPETLQKPHQSIHPVLVVAMQNNSDNYKSVSQALNTYLGDKLQTSVNGLTRSELATRLRQRELPEVLIERIEGCLAKSEMGRYGPVTDDLGWSLMVEADALLFDLDQAFGIEEQ